MVAHALGKSELEKLCDLGIYSCRVFQKWLNNQLMFPMSHNSSKLTQLLKYNSTNELNLANIYGNYFVLEQALKCILINKVSLPNVPGNSFKLEQPRMFNVTTEVKLPICLR